MLALPAIPAGREKVGDCEWLDWNQLSELGLIVRINTEVLHPVGLALYRDPETGSSAGAMISPDGKWTYGSEVVKGRKL
ncbi:hypothetical protein EHN13_08670 [Citrobacter youngae]|nr:hypothetical protein EHN13_08670 [Citrobacter youngae]